jgi:putative phage-type endonuclease
MIEKTILSSREEWLKHRMQGIGGSEISAVVGLNPYMSNVDLWELKTGAVEPEDISDKPYIKYGTQAEPLLRELFKLDFPQYEVFYEENNSFRNSKFPWALASLDGWIRDENGRVGVWECKTTNILQSMQKEKWNHQIPSNYYCQVLFYMAVIEADFAILKAQLKTEFEGVPYLQTRHYFIERADVQEDMDYLMGKGAEFWESVKNKEKPGLLLPEI